MYSLSELAKKVNEQEEQKRRAQEEANKILEEESQPDGTKESDYQESVSIEGNATERELLFARTTKMYELEIEEKDGEIRFCVVSPVLD